MPAKLSREEIVTLDVLKSKRVSNSKIARTLGVTEGAVRYQVRRTAEGRADGRRDKAFKASSVGPVIDHWFRGEDGSTKTSHAVNVRELYDHLVEEHGYRGSYRGVLRYVKATYPSPKIRPYRRIETPAGAQMQVDWWEENGIDIGDGPQKLYALVVTLSHSRKDAVVWKRRMDQLAWHDGHNQALRRLGGVAAVARIDNLKTGVKLGAGPWGVTNPAYARYARATGFHVDACLPKSPEDKGKVERRILALQKRLGLCGRRFESLEELQAWTDARVETLASRRICPATGKTVQESWQDEQQHLKPLGMLPEPFDIAVTRKVHRDATVNFENRTYTVPFRLVKRRVEIRGCSEWVQVLWNGQVVAQHRRHTRERFVFDPAHYEGPGDDRVDPPVPLGKMGRRLLEIVSQPVQERPVDLYAALAEVAR